MEKHFQYRQSTIYYTITGSGQPVVLLHGFAEDSTIWKHQLEFLQQHCMLVIPDIPGSGQSNLLVSDNVTMEDYAAFLNELLIIENIENCIVLGHSMGGYITLAFAAMFAARLKGFGFIHSTAFADSEDKKSNRRKAIKFIEEQGINSFLKNTIPNLFSPAFREEHLETIEDLIARGNSFTKEALIQYYTAIMNRPDRTALLINSNVPVLFVVSSEDTAAPLEDLIQQVHLPSVSHIHILQRVGHMSMVEKPDELNKHLLHFIKAVSIQTN